MQRGWVASIRKKAGSSLVRGTYMRVACDAAQQCMHLSLEEAERQEACRVGLFKLLVILHNNRETRRSFHDFTTMAEIIGLAASLITLAGASAQLARTLLEVANVIKSAEYEARLIAANISVFSSSLTQLSMVVDLPHSKTEKLREITVVLIGACQTLIEDLRMLIGEPFQHDPSRRAFTISLIRFRFRWMKVGPKVMFVKSLVDSFKTTIIVLVSTMNLAVVLQRDAPESIR